MFPAIPVVCSTDLASRGGITITRISQASQTSQDHLLVDRFHIWSLARAPPPLHFYNVRVVFYGKKYPINLIQILNKSVLHHSLEVFTPIRAQISPETITGRPQSGTFQCYFEGQYRLSFLTQSGDHPKLLNNPEF